MTEVVAGSLLERLLRTLASDLVKVAKKDFCVLLIFAGLTMNPNLLKLRIMQGMS